MKKRWALFTFAGLGAAALVRWQLARFFTEEPPYDLETTIGDLEIRRYPSRVVAETTVDDADWDQGLSDGFRRLAGYIFGGNRSSRQDESAAPEKIAMTSPVNARGGPGAWTVTFNMPNERDLHSLPEPLDERVKLRSTAPARIAVLRYRGRYDATRVAAAFEDLRARVRNAGLLMEGDPQFAGYDPPSTLPLLRRNEVWAELAD